MMSLYVVPYAASAFNLIVLTAHIALGNVICPVCNAQYTLSNAKYTRLGEYSGKVRDVIR